MKSTGIVRRIDELGRIVIPKKFREEMKIKEGDPLEIIPCRDGSIIIKPCRKSFEQCCHEWYNSHVSMLCRCYFRYEGDYTFCIVDYYTSEHPERAGFAKRFREDEHDLIIGKVVAYANAMGYDLNLMIGYEE